MFDWDDLYLLVRIVHLLVIVVDKLSRIRFDALRDKVNRKG